MKAVNFARKEQKWSRTSVKALLLSLAVLLMLPQWGGRAAAEESGTSLPEPVVAAQGGTNVTNFYNVIMQTGADPWVYKHTDGYYYNTFVNASGVMVRRSKTITGIEAGERSLAWSPVKGNHVQLQRVGAGDALSQRHGRPVQMVYLRCSR